MPCTASIDLSDPLLLMSHNTSILEYTGTIEFTFYAVNGAGNGNATKYTLNTTRQLSGMFTQHTSSGTCSRQCDCTQKIMHVDVATATCKNLKKTCGVALNYMFSVTICSSSMDLLVHNNLICLYTMLLLFIIF